MNKYIFVLLIGMCVCIIVLQLQQRMHIMRLEKIIDTYNTERALINKR